MMKNQSNPTIDIQKYFPEVLNCSICQQSYDKGDHQPMLICFFQHCICLSCVQSLFEYAPEDDEVLCPFCKEPVVEDCVDKFRLVEQLINSYTSLNQYNNDMKMFINELLAGNKRLKDELLKEQTFNQSNTKLIESLYLQLFNKKQKQQQHSKIGISTQKSLDSSKYIKQGSIVARQKSILKTQRNKSSRNKTLKVDSCQRIRRNITSVYYVQPKKKNGNKCKTNTNMVSNQEEDPQYTSLIPKNLTKSIFISPKNKKPLPYIISNSTSINLVHLKLVIQATSNNNKYNKDLRHSYARVLMNFDFSTLKELYLSNANLINEHLEKMNSAQNLFPCLKILDLSHNRFIEVPKVVFQVTSIQVLNLSRNCIDKLTIQITELINLIELDLWKNQFIDVPFILFNLKKLKKVDLSNNKIATIQSPLISNGRIKIDLFGNPVTSKCGMNHCKASKAKSHISKSQCER